MKTRWKEILGNTVKLLEVVDRDYLDLDDDVPVNKPSKKAGKDDRFAGLELDGDVSKPVDQEEEYRRWKASGGYKPGRTPDERGAGLEIDDLAPEKRPLTPEEEQAKKARLEAALDDAIPFRSSRSHLKSEDDSLLGNIKKQLKEAGILSPGLDYRIELDPEHDEIRYIVLTPLSDYYYSNTGRPLPNPIPPPPEDDKERIDCFYRWYYGSGLPKREDDSDVKFNFNYLESSTTLAKIYFKHPYPSLFPDFRLKVPGFYDDNARFKNLELDESKKRSRATIKIILVEKKKCLEQRNE